MKLRHLLPALLAAPLALLMLFVLVVSPPPTSTTDASICGTGTLKVPTQAQPWIAEAATTSGLPAAWLAAVAYQESSFNPADFYHDINGGTWGLFQLNREEWEKVYPAAKGSQGTPLGITDPMIHAHYAGIYLKNRLKVVQAMKRAHSEAAYAKLSDLDALVIAHNAGEGNLQRYPSIPPITKSYLANVHKSFTPGSCSATAGDSGKSGQDTYGPYWKSEAGRADGVDPWSFYWGECVSYAAWMIRTTTGYTDFTNNWHGQHFGNAQGWAAAARGAGITVNQTPAVGAIAQRTSGAFGHVALITKVNSDGSFDVNEYNYASHHTFGTRNHVKIGADFDNILHFEKKGSSS